MPPTLSRRAPNEATHDFLDVYNPVARAIRTRLGGAPFPPVFSFRGWLFSLIAAVLLLAMLTPAVAAAVRRGRRWVLPAAYIYGGVHLLNGFGHLAASVLGRRLAPGALSAPVLLAAAGWLLREAGRLHRRRVDVVAPAI